MVGYEVNHAYKVDFMLEKWLPNKRFPVYILNPKMDQSLFIKRKRIVYAKYCLSSWGHWLISGSIISDRFASTNFVIQFDSKSNVMKFRKKE